MSEHDELDPQDQPDPAILDGNLERLWTASAERPVVPADARARMLAQLRTASPSPSPSPEPTLPPPTPLRWRRVTVVSVAVAIAAAVILAWVLGLGQRAAEAPGEAPEVARYEHQGLGARAVMLSDGSRALLRSGTILDELEPGHLRLVAGEVLLEVREAIEPTLIETAEGHALVRGARVLLRSDGVETLAAVLTGSAELESSGAATSLMLRAGEQALLRVQTGPRRIAGRRLSFEVDWARELLSPDQTPEPIRRGNLVARLPPLTGQIGQFGQFGQGTPNNPSREWPLPIRELTVDVHVEAGHVRATIDQTFFNDRDTQLEGVYSFPLPANAAISRLAMYVDGKRMEAGVVERDRGRDIYEQIVHRRRDPALLEWVQGNLFQVRIFPLPARTEKRILLSYTAALDELYAEATLRVPIPTVDLPVAKVRYRIRVVGAAGREFSSTSHAFTSSADGADLIAEFTDVDHRIGADILATMHVAAPGTTRNVAAPGTTRNVAAPGTTRNVAAPGAAVPELDHHRFVDAQGRRHHGVHLRPQVAAELGALAELSEQPARDWVLLFDRSASRGPAELAAQRELVHELVAQLDGGDRLGLALFDSSVRWFGAAAGANPERRPEGLVSVASLDAKALDQFVAAESKLGLGLTNLHRIIGEATSVLDDAADSPPSGDARTRVPTILYLGDGLDQTLDGPHDLGAQLSTARAQFVAVSVGQAYDAPALDRAAALSAGLHVHIGEGESVPWRTFELLTTLATPRVVGLDALLLDASGEVVAAASTHASTRSLAAGETLDLFARLDPHSPEPVAVELRGHSSLGSSPAWNHRYELSPPIDGAGWLSREWARAEVAALSEAGVEANAAAITELGLEHFLVTPTTSLLVLESEAMYRDFAVRRPSETSWARYPAPDEIEVVRDLDRSEAKRGQYVTRTPIEVLGLPTPWVGNNVRTRGWGPLGGTEQSSVGLGGLGIVGVGRGGGGTGFGIGIGLPSASASGDFKQVHAGFGGRGRLRSEARGPRSAGESGRFIGRSSGPSQWASADQDLLAQPVTGAFASVDMPFASAVVMGANSHEQALAGLWPGSLPWTQAFHYSGDPRLDDLGELVPALFEEPFDLEREALLLSGAALDEPAGSVSPAARELIAAARAAQGGVRWGLPEGGTLDIDGEGRFALVHRRWAAVDERVVYDGEQLHADYPEWGLSVVRAVGPTSPALLAQWVPWLVPDPDHLARFYEVVATGPRSLRLTRASEQAPALTLDVEFDDQRRVTSLVARRGERLLSTTRFTWTETGLELDGGRTLTRLGPARPIHATPQATRVDYPLASPADLELELVGLAPGGPAWIAVQQRRLASSAALGQLVENGATLAALAEHAGRVLPGELVLGGAGLARVAAPQRAAILDAAREGPVRDYLTAGLEITAGRPRAMRALGDRVELVGTGVGMWASYRSLLDQSERNPGPPALAALETWLATYAHPNFAFVLTSQLSNRWWNHSSRRVAAWTALADRFPSWSTLARHQAGLAHYYAGHYDDAAHEFERAFAEAERNKTLPIVDGSVQWALTQAIGEAGWQLRWTRLRERVATSDDPRLAVRFVILAERLGRPEDGERVLDRIEPETLDPELGLELIDVLVAGGRLSEAQAVLDAVRARTDEAPALLLRASTLAEQRGDLEVAAATLEQALVRLLEDQGLTLAQLRQGFAHLFELRARLARPLANTQATAAAALASALAVADRWRLEDPDNADIDRRCAELLWALDRDDEAWRQLSSAIDRHPNDGATLAWVADTLEQAGQFERARTVWSRAIEVEPTDVHNRLREASMLLAFGRPSEAKARLQAIVDGDWQPRFGADVNRARALLAKLAEVD